MINFKYFIIDFMIL